MLVRRTAERVRERLESRKLDWTLKMMACKSRLFPGFGSSLAGHKRRQAMNGTMQRRLAKKPGDQD